MDPFGSRSHLMTSALRKQHTLTDDIYEPLFDRIFFHSKAFIYWSQGSLPWQLHCHGAPGCGKTTLAAIAAQRLRQTNSLNKAVQVASIFVDQDISTSSIAFAEDFLSCINDQLRAHGSTPDHLFARYEQACLDGESISKRLKFLRATLHARLEKNEHTFLVFDGYDRIGENLQAFLDIELSQLQSHRLRVLQTRRVPIFERPLNMWCDGLDCEEGRVKLYWTCMDCFNEDPDGYNIFCYTCKANGDNCEKHENAQYKERYEHINIDVSHPDDIEDYVTWEMQNLDQGLLSTLETKQSTTQSKTSAGINSPVEDTTTTFPLGVERPLTVVQSISRNANITITKLYLDNIHKQQSLTVVEKVGDRLPRNIVALFDAEIECIKQQPRYQSDIALMAIAAAAEKNQGVPLAILEDWMRDAIIRLPHLAKSPPRSLEDILRYANGFIAELTFTADRCISTYNVLFDFYVRENYNETLFWARSQLNIHRVARSLTFQPPKLASPPLVASPPTIDQSFEAFSQKLGTSKQGSTLDYFDRLMSSGDALVSPKQVLSPKQRSGSGDSDSEPKMFRAPSRSGTMNFPTNRKSGFTNSIVDIPEEMAPTERRESRSKGSVSKPTNRLCHFCETEVLGSGKLSGRYQRSMSQITLHVAKKCIFCSTLYKEFLALPVPERKKFPESASPAFHWTIRSTAKTRESSNSIVVSFQAILSEPNYKAEGTPQGSGLSRTNSGAFNSKDRRHIRRFHLIAESDMSEVPDRDELGPTTDPSSIVGKQITQWIHDCDHTHSHCLKATKTNWVPTRLLDLHYGDLSSVRLVKTAAEGVTGPYITLSHCWGPRTKENEFLTTQGETEKAYMTTGIKISALSTNFQQAISVAKFIGVRYIWIDSLCIIQGEHSDFPIEGSLMHRVYRNSYCNIAAADSEDSRGGIFRGRNPADILPGKYEGDGGSAMFGTKTWRIVPEDLWEEELLGSSIYTRGWVFQERMLAPRVLHFAHNQIFWDCGTLSACESLPKGLPLPLDDVASTDRHWRGRLQESSSLAHAPLSGANDDSLEGFWSASVLNYTKCNLTSQSDKSVAIWSIAKLVRDASGDDEYGAGLWATALEEQLSWKVASAEASIRSVDLQESQPSWSWTSIQGAILLPERVKNKHSYRVIGHDGGAIAFKIKGSSRPVMEREHSDSLKEDIEIGWREWQKKTRVPSAPPVRRDIRDERSHSMPIPQVSGADLTAPTSTKVLETKVDPRDLEPKLESKFIAMHGPVCTGTLHQNIDTKSFTLVATACADHVTFQGIVPEITLDACLDETPTFLDLFPHSVHFLILTATAHTANVTSFGLGLTIECCDSDSDNESLPKVTTYSGTGILLIPSEEYLRRGKFKAKAAQATMDLEVFLERSGPIAPGSSEEWTLKNLKGDADALKSLVNELERFNGSAEENRHFRRMGVVEFRDWSESMYKEMMSQPCDDIWLD